MTIRAIQTNGMARIFPVMLWVVAVIAVPALAQTTRSQATHGGGILYVRPPTEVAAGQARADDASWQRAVATHVPLIADRSKLLRVVSDPNSVVIKTAWYSRFKTPAEATDWLEKNLHVAQIPGTGLIEIWIDGDITPGDASTIIDAVGSSYISDRLNINTNALLVRKNSLDQLRTKHETAIRQLRNDVSRAQGELQMDNLGKSGAIAQKETELFQLITAKIQLESDAAASSNAMESAKAALAQASVPAAVQMQVNENPRIVEMKQQVDSLEIETHSISKDSPQYKSLVDKRTATQERLDTVTTELRTSLTVAYLDELQNKLGQTQRQIDQLDKEIATLHTDISDLSFQLARFVQTDGELETLTQTAQRERDAIEQLNTSISSADQSDIVWMEHPPRSQP